MVPMYLNIWIYFYMETHAQLFVGTIGRINFKLINIVQVQKKEESSRMKLIVKKSQESV
jgi:hypothetical protein